MTTPKIFKRLGRIIFQFPVGPGEPYRADTYFTTRGAINWPAAKFPAYYCIFGLKDEPTLTEKNPLVLLAEGEEASLIDEFFERLTLNSNRLFCERLFADLREGNEGYKKSLYEFVRDRKIENISLSDSSEFENIKYGISLIKQWHHDNALKIGEGAILRNQLKEMQLDDFKDKLDERFYAVAALIRVLTSFKAYPWRRSREGEGRIINWDRHTRDLDEDYGEYKEVIINR